MPKTVKRKKRTRAIHFGDKPSIRRKYGEAKRYHKAEPWEKAYRKRKRKLSKALKK